MAPITLPKPMFFLRQAQLLFYRPKCAYTALLPKKRHSYACKRKLGIFYFCKQNAAPVHNCAFAQKCYARQHTENTTMPLGTAIGFSLPAPLSLKVAAVNYRKHHYYKAVYGGNNCYAKPSFGQKAE